MTAEMTFEKYVPLRDDDGARFEAPLIERNVACLGEKRKQVGTRMQ